MSITWMFSQSIDSAIVDCSLSAYWEDLNSNTVCNHHNYTATFLFCFWFEYVMSLLQLSSLQWMISSNRPSILQVHLSHICFSGKMFFFFFCKWLSFFNQDQAIVGVIDRSAHNRVPPVSPNFMSPLRPFSTTRGRRGQPYVGSFNQRCRYEVAPLCQFFIYSFE